MKKLVRFVVGFVAPAVIVGGGMVNSVVAQTRPPYGSPISLELAKKVAAGAVKEARKNSWSQLIAVTDGGGRLVYLERLDDTGYAAVKVAIEKAESAAAYRVPTKVWSDLVVGGTNRILGLPGAIPIEGGLLDHLIGADQERRRNGEAQQFCSLAVDDQLKLRRLLDRQVGGFGALEDPVHISGGATDAVDRVVPVAHQTASLYICRKSEYCRQAVFHRQVNKPGSVLQKNGVLHHN